MKAVELRKEVLDYILDEVQMSVMRLGINAKLLLVEDKNYGGEAILKIESSKFQTTPVLFKELWLQGSINTFEAVEDNHIGVAISLDYYWKSFKGGTNGTELGVIRYYVEKDLPAKFGELGPRYYVNKINGLDI